MLLLALAAALAMLRTPRLGLAIALFVPLFPLGNVAQAAAVTYGVLALAWLALCWRDARAGLLFVAGPLLASIGAIALLPLAVQPARGRGRRALQAAVGVLAAAAVAGLRGVPLPLTGTVVANLGVDGSTRVTDVVQALSIVLRGNSGLVALALVLGLAAAVLPDARRHGLKGICVLGACQIALAALLAPALPPAHRPRDDRALRRPRGRFREGRPLPLDASRQLPGMSVLRTIESKIERLFEGVFGRAFRTHVQPVELARKLAKEMDEHRSVSVSRVYVPNEYTIYLSSADRQQFVSYEGSLIGELQEYLTEHARREAYALLTPPRVKFAADDDLAIGEFGIATRVAQPDDGIPPCRRSAPRPVAGARPGVSIPYRRAAPAPPLRRGSRRRAPSGRP